MVDLTFKNFFNIKNNYLQQTKTNVSLRKFNCHCVKNSNRLKIDTLLKSHYNYNFNNNNTNKNGVDNIETGSKQTLNEIDLRLPIKLLHLLPSYTLTENLFVLMLFTRPTKTVWFSVAGWDVGMGRTGGLLRWPLVALLSLFIRCLVTYARTYYHHIIGVVAFDLHNGKYSDDVLIISGHCAHSVGLVIVTVLCCCVCVYRVVGFVVVKINEIEFIFHSLISSHSWCCWDIFI